MASPRHSFEVQLKHGTRWVTETVLDKEDESRALATRLFSDKKCEGARIVKNWLRADSRVVETEIFCQTRDVKYDPPLRVGRIDSAPEPCDRIGDYYGFDSRQLMNRLFRSYFDRQILTPTELLHSSRELRRLRDKDLLVPTAIDRVATLQTRDDPKETEARRAALFRTVDDMILRARQGEQRRLPKLGDDFGDALNAVSDPGDVDGREFIAGVILSGDLLGIRSWIGKLERLCQLAEVETDFSAMAALDGAIADVLGSKVVEDLLGWRPSLGSAILGLFDLADGRIGDAAASPAPVAEMLAQLISERRVPFSRHVLIDRAHRQLRSAQPLHRANPGKTLDEFQKIAERVLTPTGLYCGVETAEALTARCARMVEPGGAAGRRAAIDECFRLLPDRASGVIYLCDAARSQYAGECATESTALFEAVLATTSLGELCQRGLHPKERMARATLAYHAMAESSYPQDLKGRVTRHIDSLLERYLRDEQIVERLDHPDSVLRDRALRLVQFCAAGLLPEGKALVLARQRVKSLLRHPDFDARFLDGIADAAHAQRTLRDFHRLLVKAGFE